MRRFLHHALAPLLSAALLIGLLAGNALHKTPMDASAYHAAVRDAVGRVPSVTGEWFGRDVPIPTGAVDALQPNALLSRTYTNAATGQQVTVLLVHCLDARDLQGHHPTICYPVNGWELEQRDEVASRVGGATVQRAVYRFRRGHVPATQKLVVHNLVVLPDGTFGNGLEAVDRIAGDHRHRHRGAAQIQLVTPPEWDAAAQDAAWDQFLRLLEPAIDAIGDAQPAR